MIQIDDSGWGSLLGGVYIGVYNTENNKMYARLIPVSYFQGDKFKRQLYLAQAREIALQGMSAVASKESKQETIQICRGYLLLKIRKKLEEFSKWFGKIEHADIKDPLQSALEEKFSKSLARYGVPDGKAGGAHRISFDAMLDWIKEDPKRVKYVKTGWDSWKKKYAAQVAKGQ
jgi:hypothetical protein